MILFLNKIFKVINKLIFLLFTFISPWKKAGFFEFPSPTYALSKLCLNWPSEPDFLKLSMN